MALSLSHFQCVFRSLRSSWTDSLLFVQIDSPSLGVWELWRKIRYLGKKRFSISKENGFSRQLFIWGGDEMAFRCFEHLNISCQLEGTEERTNGCGFFPFCLLLIFSLGCCTYLLAAWCVNNFRVHLSLGETTESTRWWGRQPTTCNHWLNDMAKPRDGRTSESTFRGL